MDIIKTAKQVILHPIDFFESLAKRKHYSIGDALRFILVIGIVYAVLGTIMSLLASMLGLTLQGLLGTPAEKAAVPISGVVRVLAALFGGVLMYAALIVGSFIGGALVWLWLALWGYQDSYAKAYVLNAYCMAPILLVGWLPLANFFTSGWQLALLILGTIHLYKAAPFRAVLMWIVSIVVVIILMLIILALGFTMLLGGIGLAAMPGS